MRKISLFILALSFSFANAQELPAPSPSASLTQRVGLTDFTVEYSRPGVKDREIFGELVPYNEVWRTGANKATSIEFNTDVTFSGKTVPAGKYSIFTIPAEGKWSFMLNKETELWGANDYKQEQDALRIAVVPAEGEMTETFTIDFTNISTNGGSLQISFANTVVSVPFEVETSEKAMSNIKEALSSSPKDKLWIVNRNAANYYLNNGLDKEEALKFIETSVKLKEDNWYSHYIHGEILSSLGRNKEAVQAAQKAMEIGQNEADKADKEFGYSAMLEEAITKWTKS
jgi:predicted negative regulator of RcsB-dependent stress response